MGSSVSTDDDEVMADINITPFVDIVLVILIIFMVTATSGVFGLAAEVPSAATADPQEGDSVGITLLRSGELLFDGNPVNTQQLTTALQNAKSTNPAVVVLISADKGVAWGRMVWLIDLLKSQGLAKYFFNTNRADAVGPDPATTHEGLGTLPSPK